MAKPILFAIDDDTSVIEAVVQDLRRHYGHSYRVLRATSGDSALETSKQLRERGDAVALFLSDQRMPGMTGVEFLQQAMTLYPDAKRVLLTAYADTEAAIRAINGAKIHYYLNKPWDPPEEKLYPVLDDLLASWTIGYRPAYEGIQVVGTRWTAADFQVRDFLGRHRVEYKWLNPDLTGEALDLLRRKGIDEAKMPVVIFGDGSVLLQPAPQEMAAKLGLPMLAKEEFYDVVVIGAGPAGLAAAVYGASEGLRTLVVEADALGGQAGSSSKIENYLGFPQGVSGEELGRRAYLQAQRLGAEFLLQRVTSIRCENNYHILQMEDGREVSCHVCLIATGVSYCKLSIPGEEQFSGAGMYYGAALSEARGCADEEVYVVGGANSAGQAAMHFSRYAAKVRMLVRGEGLEKSMSKYLIDQIASTPNIEVEAHTEVIGLAGDRHLECMTLKTPRGEERRQANSLFVFIGAAPKTGWLPSTIARDGKGFVLAGPDLKLRSTGPEAKAKTGNPWPLLERDPFLLETSVPGIFVAGDVRHNSVKRCASAVGEGSIAIQFVHRYLATL